MSDVEPILRVAEQTGQSHEELARHWAELFVVHDRVMFRTFERWCGAERAVDMQRRVWENPTAPLLEIFQSAGSSPTEALTSYARAFMIHDYYSLKILREEVGDVDAAEAHHSLWEDQAEEFALVDELERPTSREPLSWQQLYRLYAAHCDREGLPYRIVDETLDRLVIEADTCAYFDTIAREVGREAAEEHNHLIAIDSTDRTIEAFLAGIGRPDEFRGVMTTHRCFGGDACRIEFTRRDPAEPLQLAEPIERAGTRCFWLRHERLTGPAGEGS